MSTAATKPSGGGVVCDSQCGCPVPCPGGITCRCASEGGNNDDQNKRCPCGEHCGCKPCTCPKTEYATATATATAK